ARSPQRSEQGPRRPVGARRPRPARRRIGRSGRASRVLAAGGFGSPWRMGRIVLGNREGTLPVRRGRGVMEALGEAWPDLNVTVRPLQGGVGAPPLLDALAKGAIAVAVVQLDTLPTVLPEGLTLAAVCRRPEARSALVARGAGS